MGKILIGLLFYGNNIITIKIERNSVGIAISGKNDLSSIISFSKIAGVLIYLGYFKKFQVSGNSRGDQLRQISDFRRRTYE